MVGTMFTQADLDGMGYRPLQKMAKLHGVKGHLGNMGRVKMQAALLELQDAQMKEPPLVAGKENAAKMGGAGQPASAKVAPPGSHAVSVLVRLCTLRSKW